MILESSLLYYFVRDALSPYSEDFKILDRHNPTTFQLNNNQYSTHVSYVHDSGNARDNEDEVRIQTGRSLIEKQRERASSGFRVAFVGFFEGGKAFVAWDPRHVFSLRAKTIVSVYARQSQLKEVDANQAAVHKFSAKFLGETSFAIALPASALGLYLENIQHFHRLTSQSAIQQVVQANAMAISGTGLDTHATFDVEIGQKREKFSYTRKAYPRDPKFQKLVMSAYGGTCCVCSRQLGLIQAAHIIPHSEPDSPNSVQNGLALCIEHHRLYDEALLLPGPSQQLIFNQERANYLSQIGQAKGLDGIQRLSGQTYEIPNIARQKPLDVYLQRGLDIRLAS